MEQPKKLLDQVRDVIRVKHYSIRTEESYVDWIRRYILFHDKRHPKDMGRIEVEAFLTHLAVEGHVAPPLKTRRSAHCSFSTARCSRLNSTRRWIPSAPKSPPACPSFSPAPKRIRSWTA